MVPRPLASDAVLKALRAFGLAYPGAHTKSPWPDHLDLAVNDKTFAYLSLERQPFSISCKLPHSGTAALSLPFCEPTGYGLGKSGWVSASFPHDHVPPLALLKEWLDESYRAQAPKKLVASLAAHGALAKHTSKKKASKKKASANAPRARKASVAVKRARKTAAAKRVKR